MTEPDADISVVCDECLRTYPDVQALADHTACTHGLEPDTP